MTPSPASADPDAPDESGRSSAETPDASGPTNGETPNALGWTDDETPDGWARTSAGSRLSYATYGDPDGTPLAFLHGTPGSRLLGGLLDEPAADAGVQVVAPDRPGFGRSELPADYDLSDAGRTVAALADAVDAERVAVAGFSGGGPYALAAAATAPERVRSVDLVSGAVPPRLVDDSPALQRLLHWLARTTPILLSAGFRAQAALAGVHPGSVAAQYTAESSPVEVTERVERLVAADFREAFAGGADGTVADFRRFSTEWSVAVEETACPVRLWHGEADANAPVEGVRRLAGTLPEADLTTFDAHGHLETLLAARGRVVEAVARRES